MITSPVLEMENSLVDKISPSLPFPQETGVSLNLQVHLRAHSHRNFQVPPRKINLLYAVYAIGFNVPIKVVEMYLFGLEGWNNGTFVLNYYYFQNILKKISYRNVIIDC